MKTNEFETVKMFRAINENISIDISKMTVEEIQAYLKNQKQEVNKANFAKLLNNTRIKAATAPSLKIITKEVERVRAKRYTKKP